LTFYVGEVGVFYVQLKFFGRLKSHKTQPDAGKLKLWGTPKQGGKVIRYWSGEVRILASATIWSSDGCSIGM